MVRKVTIALMCIIKVVVGGGVPGYYIERCACVYYESKLGGRNIRRHAVKFSTIEN